MPPESHLKRALRWFTPDLGDEEWSERPGVIRLTLLIAGHLVMLTAFIAIAWWVFWHPVLSERNWLCLPFALGFSMIVLRFVGITVRRWRIAFRLRQIWNYGPAELDFSRPLFAGRDEDPDDGDDADADDVTEKVRFLVGQLQAHAYAPHDQRTPTAILFAARRLGLDPRGIYDEAVRSLPAHVTLPPYIEIAPSDDDA